jgi:hypothetical protein
MTTFRSEEMLVGLVALTLIPLIGMRILRGLRDGQLPLYRTRIEREAGPGRFNALLALHVLSLLLVAVVAADLLLHLGLRE